MDTCINIIHIENTPHNNIFFLKYINSFNPDIINNFWLTSFIFVFIKKDLIFYHLKLFKTIKIFW